MDTFSVLQIHRAQGERAKRIITWSDFNLFTPNHSKPFRHILFREKRC